MASHRNVEQIEDVDCSDTELKSGGKLATNPKCELDEDISGRKLPVPYHSEPSSATSAASNCSHGDASTSSHSRLPAYPMHLSWQSFAVDPNPPHICQQPPQCWQSNVSNTNPSAPHFRQEPSHLLHFFESQMRDHAAAFANAAAGAAFVSAQIAADMASASTTTNAIQYPVAPQFLPQPPYMFQNIPQPCLVPQNGTMQYTNGYGPPSLEHNLYGQLNNNAFEDYPSSEHVHRRRKRQHRNPPSATPRDTGRGDSTAPGPTGRRRRRSRNNRPSHDQGQSSDFNSKIRRRNRKAALTSSGSEGGSAYNVSKKKQRQPEPDNTSLIGKTGVAAFYVFCEKRHLTPCFAFKNDASVGAEDFEIVASVEGMPHLAWRGRGKNKSGAKQEAARLALQTLLPGVEFDKASGILISLPDSYAPQKTVQNPWSQREGATTAEDLAPNLAKLLAIGRESPGAKNTQNVHQRKHVYPETSTTSDEEDEDTYYASRGASVCSALLHAMVQIDERIPEPPVYTYFVSCPVTPSPRNNLDLKRKAGGPLSNLGVFHRGSFNCTGTMGVEVRNPDTGRPSFDILQAIGVGGTKREARHRASAKLLAMLFPECDGMVAVKQAAEAFRERYAADKALKQQSKRRKPSADVNCIDDPTLQPCNIINSDPSQGQFEILTNGPKLSPFTEDHILCALECARCKNALNVTPSDGPLKSRQLSRQAQLDNAISLALQKLNEHDEDGRSLPDELTVDDVGRTVLRRSTPADVHWIMKLIESEGHVLDSLAPPFGKANEHKTEIGEAFHPTLLRHWLSSSIVLLLCRAIAPFEDPPLGCAALRRGFSMERGPTLRVAQIASKSHLPLERFIEVLQSFSREMSCTLEFSEKNLSSTPTKVRCEDVEGMLQSHLVTMKNPIHVVKKEDKPWPIPGDDEEESCSSIRLHSVQEELEDIGDYSGIECTSEKRNSKPGQVKPSKRTRVQ